MITPDYVRTMAAYHAEMNRRVYAAAGLLTDASRREDRGVFWGSLHGTLNHLLWGDRLWMARFAGWAETGAGGSSRAPNSTMTLSELSAARAQADADMSTWTAGVDQAWLDDVLRMVQPCRAAQKSGSPRNLQIVHLFNHQTHHRGQAHALLTHFGHDSGDTDLPLVLGQW